MAGLLELLPGDKHVGFVGLRIDHIDRLTFESELSLLVGELDIHGAFLPNEPLPIMAGEAKESSNP